MDNLPNNPEMAKPMEVKTDKESKPKKVRKPKPILMPMSTMKAVERKFNMEESPTDWEKLSNGDTFSRDANGITLMCKASKSSAVDLTARKMVAVSGAAVYRVYL